jgi:hypothetical protein
MWNWFTDKFTTFIAYLCLPVTYPIYLYQTRKMDKEYEKRKMERERINKKINLRK